MRVTAARALYINKVSKHEKAVSGKTILREWFELKHKHQPIDAQIHKYTNQVISG